MDVNVFYDADSARGNSKRDRIANAKAICATCPVITQCLQRAVTVGEPGGVWRGLTAKERAALSDSSVTAVA